MNDSRNIFIAWVISCVTFIVFVIKQDIEKMNITCACVVFLCLMFLLTNH
jgi:hypothetical protein